ncbi:MAG: ABC transporter permease [Patescibacteria group bacterium]|jgi:putative ABC transport system permease protein
MRVGDLFNLSTRMFRTRPARTWLTILGISVGISAVLFLVALGYGLQNIILEKIVFNQALLSLTVTPVNELIFFNDEALADLKKIPNVADIAPQASFNGQAIMDKLHGTAEIRAVDSKFFEYAGVAVANGKLFDEKENDQALISEAVLKLFGMKTNEEIIGQKIYLQLIPPRNPAATTTITAINLPQPFVVKGVIADPQDSYVYVSLSEVAKNLTITKYDQARVRVATNNDINQVKGQILEKGYQVASLSETIDQANKIFQVIQIVLGLFGAVALVVSSIGMFNTMTVTLLERTNEIGIMRAIGATKSSLKSMFLFESLIIGFFGGVVGEGIGIGFAMLFNFGVNTLAGRFGGAKTDLFYFPGWFLSGVIILSMVIGFLSGVFPARRASNLEPLEALRYK